MWRNISCGRWLEHWQRAQPIFGGVGGDYGALATLARSQPPRVQFLISSGPANAVVAAKFVNAHGALASAPLALAIRNIVISHP
jgi:hypothetical protein